MWVTACFNGCLPAHPANERPAKHLENHLGDLFTFLRDPAVGATNWRAEQANRPAVVNRKVWGGNRTWNGAEVQSTLLTVLVTAAQQTISPSTFSSRTSPQHYRCAFAHFIAESVNNYRESTRTGVNAGLCFESTRRAERRLMI
ncbi:transposase [bacterium]|nr:transposase [bacterium]